MGGNLMSKMNVVRRCYNCGAILQDKKKGKEGYISQEILSEAPLNEILFCEKCYNEARYNIAPQEASVSNDFLTMLLDAQATEATIVYLLDLFSFECSFNSKLTSLIQRLPIMVIANKRDLMPEEANDDDLKEYVAHRCRVAGLKVVKDDVVLMSLHSVSDMKDIYKLLEEKRRRHDVYIIGASGSGKSFFLSSFLHGFTNNSLRSIVIGNYPGTNLRTMQIPLDSSSMIYDTPGTGIDNSFMGKADFTLQKQIFPSEPIRLRKIILHKNDSIFIGGLARIDLIGYEEKKHCQINCFFSSDVSLKKVSERKDMDEYFVKCLESGALSPSSNIIASKLTDFDVFDIAVEEEGSRDIGIAGLGWINFQGDKQTFRIYVPKGIGAYASRAKVKIKC
jgi:ribosome biogenesis GTPase A